MTEHDEIKQLTESFVSHTKHAIKDLRRLREIGNDRAYYQVAISILA